MSEEPTTRTFTLPDGTEVQANRDTHSVTIPMANGTALELFFGQGERPLGQRQCGSCSLCCKLLPVSEVGKPANQKCSLSRHRAAGCCTVYGKPAFPRSCAQWACRWLLEQDVAVPRPDRAHYVIDVLPDTIKTVDTDGSERAASVVQIWQDPAYPHAHQDPRLRAWIAANAQATGMAALVRTGRGRDLLLAPPSLSDSGEWFEREVTVGDNVGLWETTDPLPAASH